MTDLPLRRPAAIQHSRLAWPDTANRNKLYQYANRLAHLYFLRHLNGVEAYLLLLYFADPRMRQIHVPSNSGREHNGWRKNASV